MNILTISNNHNSDIDVIFWSLMPLTFSNKIVKCEMYKKVVIEYNT